MKPLKISVLFGFFGLIVSAALAAAPEPGIKSPPDIPGAVKVDAEGVIEKAYEIQNLLIIDSRVASDRYQGHIEGDISLPNTETSCATLAAVISALDAPVLFYCNGPKCGRSAEAVKIALECGYSRIYWFRGGYEEWTNKGYPVVKE